MRKLRLLAWLALLAACAGGAIREYGVARHGKERIAILAERIERARQRCQALRPSGNRAIPAVVPVPPPPPLIAADDSLDGKIRALLAKEARLKRWFAANPRMIIPEMAYLTEQDWLEAAKSRLTDDGDFRREAAGLRYQAMTEFEPLMQKALQAYVAANQGMLPSDVLHLQPYFDSPVDPALLPRYQMYATGDATRTVSSREIGPASASVVDEDYDQHAFFIGTAGFGNQGLPAGESLALQVEWYKAESAYAQANNGARYPQDSPEVLAPFFQNPADATTFLALQTKWRAARSNPPAGK